MPMTQTLGGTKNPRKVHEISPNQAVPRRVDCDR